MGNTITFWLIKQSCTICKNRLFMRVNSHFYSRKSKPVHVLSIICHSSCVSIETQPAPAVLHIAHGLIDITLALIVQLQFRLLLFNVLNLPSSGSAGRLQGIPACTGITGRVTKETSGLLNTSTSPDQCGCSSLECGRKPERSEKIHRNTRYLC